MQWRGGFVDDGCCCYFRCALLLDGDDVHVWICFGMFVSYDFNNHKNAYGILISAIRYIPTDKTVLFLFARLMFGDVTRLD